MWFQNNPRVVVLALAKNLKDDKKDKKDKKDLQGDKKVEDLTWFLEELRKDLRRMSALGKNGGPAVRDAKHVHEVPEEDVPWVDESLKTLRGHPRCKSATYRPSRNSFFVIRKDHGHKESRVKELKKKRSRSWETDHEDVVRNLFHAAVNELMLFLDDVPVEDLDDSGSDDVNQQAPATVADKAQAIAMTTSDEVPDEAGSDDEVPDDGPEDNLICPLCHADNSEYYGRGKGTPFGEPCPQCPDEERYSPATLAARRAPAVAPAGAPAVDSE